MATLSVDWTFLLPILVCSSSALPSLSLHAPRHAPSAFWLPRFLLSPCSHPIFFGDSTSLGGFPTQYKHRAYLQPGHGSDVLHVDQPHIQPHQLHPVCGKTSPPSTSAQQPPESHPVASHNLCPAVAFTAAPAQHCKAGVAPALGSDRVLSRSACQHQRPWSLQNPAGLTLQNCPHNAWAAW